MNAQKRRRLNCTICAVALHLLYTRIGVYVCMCVCKYFNSITFLLFSISLLFEFVQF